jgi:hypothetical protein
VSRHRLASGRILRPAHIAIGATVVLVLAAGAWAVLGTGGGRPGTRDQPAAAAPPIEPSDPPTASPTPSPSPSRTPSAKPSPAPSRPAPPPAPAGQTRSFAITYYGAADNDPPGSRAIAYSTVHSQAGGTGTFRDPITFATDRTELPVGTVIYYAPLRRYFVMEDDCTECDEEWRRSRSPHIDLWAGTATDSGIIRCENSLTRDGQSTVLVNPPGNLPVSPGQLYDNGRCVKPQ